MEQVDILSMDLVELKAWMKEMGEPAFRGEQIFDWLHAKHVKSFDEMTNLSKSLREKLEREAKITPISIVRCLVSQEDGTRKYLFALEGGSVIESVFMRYEYGNTVCISTQVGCRMGCKFCASTLDGVERNLTAGEMLSQIYEISRDVDCRVSSVVLMGSGEPLDNYDAVMRFLSLIHHEKGLNLSHRHITLSTCGLVDRMYDFMREKLQITLAVSLHAPNDEIRHQIMPISNAYSMERLLEACKAYTKETGRRITFEYALMAGVNDSDACANELADRLHGMLAHVNLIPVNDVKERDFNRSSNERIRRFAAILQKRSIETTIRRRLGSDIDAACGQLRRGYLKEGEV